MDRTDLQRLSKDELIELVLRLQRPDKTSRNSSKRRVLLLLAIWVVRDRDAGVAERIARMLPMNHAGVKWALAGAKGKLDDTALDDLGDPVCVEQVLSFMRPKKKR